MLANPRKTLNSAAVTFFESAASSARMKATAGENGSSESAAFAAHSAAGLFPCFAACRDNAPADSAYTGYVLIPNDLPTSVSCVVFFDAASPLPASAADVGCRQVSRG